MKSTHSHRRPGRTLGLILSLLAAASLAGCDRTTSQEPRLDSIEIVDFGLYETEIMDKYEHPGLPSGEYNTNGETKLLEQTDRIPARLGVHFGLRLRAVGNIDGAEMDVVCSDTYPGLPDPGRTTPMTEGEFSQVFRLNEISPSLFTFEHEWEMVPGEWTFSFWHRGKQMAEKTFTVYQP